jgi:phytoene dehydrogenase-like protein
MVRPALTLSNYQGPIPGLYLTGASTHPGGDIMGAAGLNAAGVLLHDLSRRRWQFWRRFTDTAEIATTPRIGYD